MSYAPRSILVIDTSPFGRSLSLLPSVRALRAAYPKTFITVAVNRGMSELLTAQKLADEVIDLGQIKSGEQGPGASLKRLAQLVRKARRDDFDLVLDFSPRLETQALTRLFLRGRTITPSKLSNILDSLLGRRERGWRSADHGSECESVLSQLGLRCQEPGLLIEVPEDEHAKFEQNLERHGSRGGEPIVILHASNSGETFEWPVAHFAELASRLASNYGARIVALDDPACDGFTDAVGKLMPGGGIKMCAPRALELAAACARASIVVTDDSGLAALCGTVGTPVIELADFPAPSHSRSHRVVQGSSRGRIEVEEVYSLACEMLRESRTVSLFHR
ncbi:MAG TPA: glycosyltransferase family 9 protein [Blastocatellia bacterium]|nr:glycosyltransferase family 9 protein [Blastocatellia bacterium]